jgi:hypothetical protein
MRKKQRLATVDRGITATVNARSASKTLNLIVEGGETVSLKGDSTGKITATVMIPLAAYSEVVARLEQLEQIDGVYLDEVNLAPDYHDD